MDEKYRLIFRGEILEGQHRAVVKRRLMELLKLDPARLEKLFSGEPVVLKRDADRKTAARYQALFKQAGGRLRVKALHDESGEVAPSLGPVSQEKSAELPDSPVDPKKPGAGNIQAPDLKVQSTWFPPPEGPRPEIQAPDFPVAEVGARMADPKDTPHAEVEDVVFDVAEVGAELLLEKPEMVAVDVGPLDFEVAEVGADLGPAQREPEPEAPDVSHLSLLDR